MNEQETDVVTGIEKLDNATKNKGCPVCDEKNMDTTKENETSTSGEYAKGRNDAVLISPGHLSHCLLKEEMETVSTIRPRGLESTGNKNKKKTRRNVKEHWEDEAREVTETTKLSERDSVKDNQTKGLLEKTTKKTGASERTRN